MVEIINHFKGKIKQKGIFTFKKFYIFAYEYLKYEGYTVHEKRYLEEIEKQGKKIEITWIAEKNLSDYFKFVIQIDWLILRMNDIEVMKEGQKVKMQKGEPELKIKGLLYKDYDNKWETPFFKNMRHIYDDHIIWKRIDSYKDKLLDETEEFIRQCKSYLTIEGYPEVHKDYA